jgi:hypothetical protein
MPSNALLPHAGATPPRVRLPRYLIIVAFLVGLTTFHIWLHVHVHGAFSFHQAVIAGFLVVNELIAFWEMAIFFGVDSIRADYLANKDKFEGRAIDRVVEVLVEPVPLSKVFSFQEWRAIWSAYCHLDDGYGLRRSFGYNIDVGNGFTTLIPSALFAVAMTYPILPARLVGVIGIAFCWQMSYGTILYLFQFFNAGRYQRQTRGAIAVVLISNGTWILFPLWTLLASIWLVYHDSYALFTDPGGSSSIWSALSAK